MKFYKRFIYIFLLIVLVSPFSVFAYDLDLYSSNVVLYNMNEDSVLYEKDKDEVVSIASLTKIMTAIVSLEHISNLDESVVLNNNDFIGIYENNLATAGFYVGETVTYRDLLYGLMLPSGAECAKALSNRVAGGEEEFVNLMNDKAKELGLKHTNFVNTTGIDADGHYSSVDDVATMFKYALKNDDFYNIINSKTYTTSSGRITLKSTIKKSEDLYNIDMDYLIGGKTGTTGDAGLCLATIAKYNGVEYLLVTTGAPYPSNVPGNLLDAKTTYEYFMNNYSYQDVVNKGDLLVKINTKYIKYDKLSFLADEDISMYLENDFDKSKLTYKYNGIDEITPKMKANTKLGTVDIYYNDQVLTSVDIILDKKQSLDIIKFIKINKIVIIIPSVILVILIGFIIKRKKK